MSHLKPGDAAPAFSGENEQGAPVSLGDFKGKKLILYFYPKDDTPGCTAEACSLRDDYDRLREMGFEILGVSPDKPAKHQKFIEKYGLPFQLLADTDTATHQAYGVWGLKKFMGKEYMGTLRTTFVIDENGIISHVIDKVNTKGHADQIMELMAV